MCTGSGHSLSLVQKATSDPRQALPNDHSCQIISSLIMLLVYRVTTKSQGCTVADSNSIVFHILLGIICSITLITWIVRRINQTKGRSIQPAEIPSKTTILSGTTPHEMGGEISDQLRSMQRLPDTGWTNKQIPHDLLNKVTNKAITLNTFSVLQIFRTQGASSPEKKNGVEMSWRADCVRPDKMHVSQSSWNEGAKYYELDEWITIEQDLYANFGLWGKIQDEEVIKERSEVNSSLLPETVLSEFLTLDIEYIGLLEAEGLSYVFLQTTMQEEQGKGMMAQIWVDEKTLLVRKHRLAVYENNVFVAEQVTTFIEHARDLPIYEPEWLNLDNTNTVINDSVCVVEHWW